MKALENVRNSQLGHIFIDYRIACAMLNFTHKPLSPDGEKTKEIAQKMKLKSNIKENKLLFLLKRQLDTHKIRKTSFNNIKQEFPQVDQDEIKREITFGSFHFKQSKSYIKEIINNKEVFLNSTSLLFDKDIPDQVFDELTDENQKF